MKFQRDQVNMSSQQTAFAAPTTTPRHAPSRGIPGIDHEGLLEEVSELIEATTTYAPAAALALVGEALARPLGLTCVVLFKKAAGQSRMLAWWAPNVTAARRLSAREQAWMTAAELLDHGMPVVGPSGPDVAGVAVEDLVFGLAGMMYVESTRALDEGDRWLLEQVLHMLVGVRDPRVDDVPARRHVA